MEQEKSVQKRASREEGGRAERAAALRRNAVIVGGSSGIGKETALRLASQGMRVFNISRTPLQGDRVHTLTADASQEGELKKAIEQVGEETGSIDLLVYSAGFSMAAPLEYARSGDYRYLFEVNYFGAIEAVRACAPYLKKRGGRVVLIGSVGGELPIPFDGFYSASKAALCMLAREADLEMRPFGVRVSALLAGGTSTGFTYSRKIYTEEESKHYSPFVRKASAALANMEQGGMPPSLVADAVLKLAAKKNPSPVNVAGGRNKATRYVYKLLPERVTDWMVRKKFNQR